MRKHALKYEPASTTSVPWTTMAWRIVLLTIAFPIVLMALFAPRR
jgi:hypothetical protein